MLTVEAHDDAFWAKEFQVEVRSNVKDVLQLISNPSMFMSGNESSTDTIPLCVGNTTLQQQLRITEATE
jgi:hypothetical protein